MRLRPGTHVLWREPGVSQLGVDPARAVVLDGLERAEQTWLDTLEQATSTTGLMRHGRSLGLPAARVRRLLDRLGPVLTEDETDPALAHRGLTAEVEHWGRVGEPAEMVAGRVTRSVGVLGLGRLGLAVAGLLAAAGVGTVLVEDPRRVRRHDVGGGGYLPADLGKVRAERAQATLRATFPHLRTTAPPLTRPDAVVLVEQDVSDPVRQRPLMAEDVAHLLVVVRELDVAVGPLVTPGRGACGRCLDLHRTDADARWPALATQLLGTTSRGAEVTASAVAAGLAAGEVLAHLDGRAVATAGATLLVDPRRPVPGIRQWPVHPQCGCTGLPGTVSGDGGVLPGPAAAALGGDDLAADEDLATPDAPGFLAGDGTGEARLAHRAATAQ